MPDSTVTCAGLVKIYWTPTGEVHALKGIDATFPTAAVSAVVGPSGSGKSSLLRILAAMDRATAGSVSVGGARLDGLSGTRMRQLRRRLLGYVFQRPADNLIPYMNLTEQLMPSWTPTPERRCCPPCSSARASSRPISATTRPRWRPWSAARPWSARAAAW